MNTIGKTLIFYYVIADFYIETGTKRGPEKVKRSSVIRNVGSSKAGEMVK
jgi:hypothetical protein